MAEGAYEQFPVFLPEKHLADDFPGAKPLVSEDSPSEVTAPFLFEVLDGRQNIARNDCQRALCNVRIRAQLRETANVHWTQARKGNDGGIAKGRILPNEPTDPASVNLWHHDVQDDVIRLQLPSRQQGLKPVTGYMDLEPLVAQEFSDGLHKKDIIVGKDNGLCRLSGIGFLRGHGSLRGHD